MLVALTDRLARRIDPERVDDGDSRRSFLAKAAVLGAALATNPLQWILKPGTAYANVCGDGVGCGTCWTVFCCPVNNGANTCPEGTFAAGWWKADASAFCGGVARYYIDCNRLPSQPGACSCISCHGGNGTCDQRRYCCNVFRYGQCHTEIPGVTPVVCRVITCTPPWQWDPTCSTSPRTDNRTGQHTAPCLPGPGANPITLKYQDLGMSGSPLGAQLTAEEDAPGGGRRVTFEHGQIHWRADLGAFGSWGGLHDVWTNQLGGPGGEAGYPRSDTRPDPHDRVHQHFEHLSLYWTPAANLVVLRGPIRDEHQRVGGTRGFGYPVRAEEDAPHGGRQVQFEGGVVTWREDLGAHAVYGGIREKWVAVGGAAGYGLPWTDEVPTAGRGVFQSFTGGAIFFSPQSGAHEVHEPVLAGYQAVGGTGGAIGFPVTDVETLPDGALWSRFERGAVTHRADLGAHALYGAIYERWTALGGPTGSFGLPFTNEQSVGDRRGRIQWFDGAIILWSARTGAHDVPEPLLSAYQALGGPAASLGYPVADTEHLGDGAMRCRFERGTLVADSAGNVTQQ